MKILFTLFSSLICLVMMAQENPMQKLAMLAGNWQGIATVQQGPGNSTNIDQYEKVRYVLDGRVLLIRGNGVENGDTTFKALGVLSYDQSGSGYSFRTFLADGKQTDAYFKLISENKIEWGFKVPTGKIKYVIHIEDNGQKWIEKGYFSPDENTSYPFFSMELQKV